MNVSTRNIAAVSIVAICTAGFAAAQHTGGHVVVAPTVTVGGNGQPSGDSGNCCVTPNHHIIHAPGVTVPPPSVYVGGGSATVGVNTYSYGTSYNESYSYSGQSSRYFSSGGVSSTHTQSSNVMNELNVQGGEKVTKTVTEQVPHIEEYCAEQDTFVSSLRPVQAVCIDDKGAPHPASQVFDEDTIGAEYSGEVFRCMAGTYMQVTYGEQVDGKADFSQSQTFSCAKGEALTHAPGGGLSCAKQQPQRNCNERSLLRRYGPGVKMVHAKSKAACIPTTRTVMKTVTREVEVEKPISASGKIVLDGGVGSGVYK